MMDRKRIKDLDSIFIYERERLFSLHVMGYIEVEKIDDLPWDIVSYYAPIFKFFSDYE